MRGISYEMEIDLYRLGGVDRDVRKNGRYRWSEWARSKVWIQGMGKHGMFQKPNSYI